MACPRCPGTKNPALEPVSAGSPEAGARTIGAAEVRARVFSSFDPACAVALRKPGNCALRSTAPEFPSAPGAIPSPERRGQAVYTDPPHEARDIFIFLRCPIVTNSGGAGQAIQWSPPRREQRGSSGSLCGHRPFLRAPPALECSGPAELWIAARAGDFTRPVGIPLCQPSKAALPRAALQGAPRREGRSSIGSFCRHRPFLRAPPALECSGPAELWIAARAGDFTRRVRFTLCQPSKAALPRAALQGAPRREGRGSSGSPCGHRPFLRAPPVLECSDPRPSVHGDLTRLHDPKSTLRARTRRQRLRHRLLRSED